ncbi:M48 family metallopeptidase [Natronobacterium texcoconense]|uniref:Heat shock protein HtpX n=1 Tax=Natronobacterium texcoconense TaxID=1095778 RepID=A0A1H1GM01_NATTX|nr:M48 family metalloprotease [Natronobacterium texcoconense]SDR14242.1 heat shock protein HtpX [Natronobacterium texcoconense]
MSGRSRWSLRLRLVGTLTILVLVATGVLAVVAWALFAVASALGLTGSSAEAGTPLPLAGGTVVLAACLLLLVHGRYGYRRTLESVDARPVEDGDPHGLRERVRRFALAAGVEEPSVAVADTDEPTTFTVSNGTDATVVVTTGALETLSADELEAVLAHEVAHLANRDATVATVAATIGSISEGLFARERRLGEWIRFLLTIGSVTIVLALVAIPIVVLSAFYLLVSVLARTVLAINAISVGFHARAREYAADRAGAELVGDPAALASALQTLDGAGPPNEDARRRSHASATLGIVPYALGERTDADLLEESSLSRWIPDADSELDRAEFVAVLSRLFGRIGRALEWRPATHPPVEKRIERLRNMSRERVRTVETG